MPEQTLFRDRHLHLDTKNSLGPDEWLTPVLTELEALHQEHLLLGESPSLYLSTFAMSPGDPALSMTRLNATGEKISPRRAYRALTTLPVDPSPTSDYGALWDHIAADPILARRDNVIVSDLVLRGVNRSYTAGGPHPGCVRYRVTPNANPVELTRFQLWLTISKIDPRVLSR